MTGVAGIVNVTSKVSPKDHGKNTEKHNLGVDSRQTKCIILNMERTWKYTVSRWTSMKCGHHYHVTLYADNTSLREVFSYDSGVDHSQKFNTYEEVTKFVKKVRQKLRRNNIRLVMLNKDLSL